MNNDLKWTYYLIILLFVILSWMLLLGIFNKVGKIEEQLITKDQPAVKELTLSVSGSIVIEQIPIISVNSVGENIIGMGERSIYADKIDELEDYEKVLICQITFREAGNQSIEGKRAVIEVILNRVMDDV